MKDPIPTFSYLVSEIAKRHPDFAYVHVIEARFSGGTEREVPEGEVGRFDHAHAILSITFFCSRGMSSSRIYGPQDHSSTPEGIPVNSL